MKIFRRLFTLLFVLCALLMPALASQASSNTLHIVAQVPENYGVSFPDNAIRFGDFAFEVELEIETEFELDSDGRKALISEDKISIGEIAPGLDSFNFSLVYYGNLSKPYRTEIIVDPNIVWVMEGSKEIISVPIEVKLKRSSKCDEDIVCLSSRDGQTYIEIPPAGPREGVPVVDIDVSWEGARNLLPGQYSTELKLDMRVI